MIFIDFFHDYNFKPINFKKNEVIKNELEICNSIGYIVKGEINIYTSLIDDDKYMITTLHENDIFGESLVFSSKPNYLGSIVCTKDTTIIFITKEIIEQTLNKNPLFLKVFLEIISNKSLQLSNRCKILSQKNIRSKIIFFLISEIKNNKSNIVLIKSKESLASYLNIPRPSLSRELISLKKDNIINYTRNYIILKNYTI